MNRSPSQGGLLSLRLKPMNSPTDITVEAPENAPVRSFDTYCTVSQRVGTDKNGDEEMVTYERCKPVHVFASGTVLVSGAYSDKVLHPSAGVIQITREDDSPSDLGFYEGKEN